MPCTDPGVAVRDPLSQGDRARRPRRRQLHESHLGTDHVVVIGVEPDLVGIEGLGPIDVRDRDRHQFEFPVHDRAPRVGLRAGKTAASPRHLPPLNRSPCVRFFVPPSGNAPQDGGEPGVLVGAEVAAERCAQSRDVDGVRLAELLAAGGGCHDDRGPAVARSERRSTSPSASMRCTSRLKPGWLYRGASLAAARSSAAGAAARARSRYASAENTPESMPASLFERGARRRGAPIGRRRRARSNWRVGSRPVRRHHRSQSRRGSSSTSSNSPGDPPLAARRRS